ncbi:MAG: phosphate ABC transporter, permease protein PstA [Candidatus Dactylopiibacterium carminicum]|uniref:Phosphate transport system permease protein PstA n=1 Tax=Candidatus Dactylopiibacterium carminicum TaxID=857335 RepID=A0A272EQ51_9RHOO|nr:phosphate ABC transporter permease PstA [Candidatus Dactylopiibacterium carminicum]KAF7598431.1 phosphate ABC transporter, permease protein PstA [Candidatus Dactylopiibacterium carminicum]PAS92176.1 MAG: phosphate ABC transporter, permease protein PstA [Candidatus Dactylopiibacterium carminicum]PAS95673.1 MAG: phosphate ABC transporter, permease protein PstA [Candidatus Dactylopiibacterium carminicum]PAS97665.1 MAG: phosphate ABC transporter, permease protein PstA [Candidatus Dactylopiibacte
MQEPDLLAIRAIITRHKRWDLFFGVLGICCLMVGVLTLVALFVDMWSSGAERLSLDFLSSFPSRRAGQAGILAAWVGSVLVMLVTASFAIPLGVAAGVYLEEYAPKNWLTDIIEINVSNLAGVPSIVYGLLGLGMFVYTFGLGRSILTAGLTLALLILPVVIVVTREAIRAIPQMIREASYACGATTWQTVRDHIVPYSSAGILTGVIIGMARAIGETAPLIVVGAVTFIAYLPPVPFTGEPAAGLFDWAREAFTVLPIQMFNWTARPDAAFHANAAAGLVLVAMTVGMNALAIWLRYRLRKNIKW